jgi:ribosomal protein S18
MPRETGKRMRHKNEIIRKFEPTSRKMLLDFRDVLVLKRFISVKRIHPLRMMRVRRRFRARTA